MAEEISYGVWEVPSGRWTVKKKFVGTWRITELKDYDDEYRDMCGAAKLKISSRGSGSVNFGAVEAEIDGKMDELDARVLRFTFEGGDEGDPMCGRGYCLVEGDEMVGRMFRHFGDEFGFKAKRLAKDEKKKPNKAPEPTA
jgi:hypothetical protein